jgi:maleylpyruvate isomerase
MTDELALLSLATQRLVRTVDTLSDDQWNEPSALPHWSRGHVIAHLTLNAEALAGVLDSLAGGTPVPMYPSQDRRDADIASLSTARPAGVRERFLACTTLFARSAAAVPPDAWSPIIERVPGGPTFPADGVIGMRLRETEIHHVDLQAGYHHRDWPIAFSTHVIDAMAQRYTSPGSFRVAVDEVEFVRAFGPSGSMGPVVGGSAADLAWWLTGRGQGEGLSSNDGVLPGIESW